MWNIPTEQDLMYVNTQYNKIWIPLYLKDLCHFTLYFICYSLIIHTTNIVRYTYIHTYIHTNIYIYIYIFVFWDLCLVHRLVAMSQAQSNQQSTPTLEGPWSLVIIRPGNHPKVEPTNLLANCHSFSSVATRLYISDAENDIKGLVLHWVQFTLLHHKIFSHYTF